MIDTHCHLTFPEFVDRVAQTLTEAAQAGVRGVISISTTPGDAQRVLAVARAHRGVWCSAGVHPLYSDEADTTSGGPLFDWPALERCIADPKCVAWGELGLDKHYAEPDFALQRRVLDEHLACIAGARARGIDKPVVVHCREAFDELIPVLRASGVPGERFVFHCFTAGPREMRMLLDLGAMVSFTGVVTYKNAGDVREALQLAPLDRVMIETDAPYLSPEPCRAVRPCTPAFARITAEFVAQQRGLAFADFERAIDDNTARFFGVRA